jgi:hypothetical protein
MSAVLADQRGALSRRLFLFVYRVRRGISHDIQDLCLLLEQAEALTDLLNYSCLIISQRTECRL